MANGNTPAQEKATKVSTTLLDQFGKPLFFLLIGYGLGFFHGNSSGKKKQISSGA